MKSYIMFGILLTLLQKKRCTMNELARKFEVSSKTISRHTNALAIAGVPIVCFQGKGGGVEVEKTFSLNNGFLTNEEQNILLSLLQSGNVVLDTATKNCLKDKLSFCNTKTKKLPPNVHIDILPWYQTFKQNNKYQELKKLCYENKKIEIEYEKQNGLCSKRIIEPHLILYKESVFYLYAFCDVKKDFRLFKISRIKNFCVLEEEFERKNIDYESEPWNNAHFQKIDICFSYKQKALPEIEEWLTNFSIDKENRTITTTQPLNNWLINKILSFEDNIKILSPQFLIEDIKQAIKKVSDQYV